MTTGKINVSVENIFPLIKKFLYSDHEIFLRELVSNGTDATLKLKHLTSIGEAKTEYGNPIIEVKIDKKVKNSTSLTRNWYDGRGSRSTSTRWRFLAPRNSLTNTKTPRRIRASSVTLDWASTLLLWWPKKLRSSPNPTKTNPQPTGLAMAVLNLL
jgi:hypothetical protein